MKRWLLILLGNTLYALGVVLFIVPNGLVTGGTTGLGLAAHHFFDIPMSSFVAIFNIIMFVIGYVCLGKQFAMSTLLSTVFYPILLSLLENTIGYQKLTNDPLLASICGGILIGLAIGIVVKNNASTGGMDIPPLVVNKKYGVSVSIAMYAFDFAILLLQMFYTNIEYVLYGIFMVLIYTVVLDKALLIGTKQIQVMIVSKYHEEIKQKIISDLDRTVTMLHATTGYKKHEYPVIMCVLSYRQLSVLNMIVSSIDPHAFMTVSEVTEVKGRGFSDVKEYLTCE